MTIFRSNMRYLLLNLALIVALAYTIVYVPNSVFVVYTKPKTIKVKIYSDDPVFRGHVISSLEQWDKASIIDFKIVEHNATLRVYRKGTRENINGTFTGHTRSSGKIVINKDIRLDSYLITNVLLHEIGHFLLGHSHSEDRNSIMYYSAGERSARKYGKKLKKIDIDRLKALEIK